ncbi:MAG TPA: hypothetical protein VK589_10270 [Chryseolinea sp.]|nr:hypothetical protein [Chryseolinea sp.]
MTSESKLMCGMILLTIPGIQYGGYFLLRVLTGGHEELALNDLQKSMFRAGHAHAGVLVILSLICQPLVDEAAFSVPLGWLVRAFIPAAALLISGGFFFSVIGKGVTRPNGLIAFIYVGVVLLAVGLVTLGIGLLRSL